MAVHRDHAGGEVGGDRAMIIKIYIRSPPGTPLVEKFIYSSDQIPQKGDDILCKIEGEEWFFTVEDRRFVLGTVEPQHCKLLCDGWKKETSNV